MVYIIPLSGYTRRTWTFFALQSVNAYVVNGKHQRYKGNLLRYLIGSIFTNHLWVFNQILFLENVRIGANYQDDEIWSSVNYTKSRG